jgi:uncharacterized protein CbrC (UPF0167 family)
LVILDDLRGEIRRLTHCLTCEQSRTDPYVEAVVACVEAADSICAAIAERDGSDRLVPDEAFQDALRATRAAAVAIRFAMVREADEHRRCGVLRDGGSDQLLGN